jgi:hypothetical protein
MTTNRRSFFRNIAFCAASLMVLPAAVASNTKEGPYRVLYTVTGNSDESIEKYLKMQDANGISKQNRKLKAQGLIVNKGPFQVISNCNWQCTLEFKSEKAFKDFLNTSHSIVDHESEFKKSNNIKSSFSHIG